MKPRNPIMSYSEMCEMNEQTAKNRLYSKDADASERISAMISDTKASIERMPKERISLNNTELVRSTALMYLTSCDATGCLPSKIGLARACGISRTALDDFMAKNPTSRTTEFLETFFDACAELLSNAALIGGVHPIFGIFVAKAIYKWKDVQQVEVVNTRDALHDSSDLTAAEVAQKYAELPED